MTSQIHLANKTILFYITHGIFEMKQCKADLHVTNCLNKAKLFARGKSVSSRDIDMGIKGISIVYPELTHF